MSSTTTIIPAGWAGFYDAASKKLFGISEFKKGGKAHTKLTLICKPTREEVVAALVAEGVVVPS
jgi:hypothetical protein